MESFLNILWVAIALSALALWRLRWIRERGRSTGDSLQEWTAFGCALVLLFFSVSMSDDLHSEIVVLEESSFTRRHSHVLTYAHQSAQDRAISASSAAAILPAGEPFDPAFAMSALAPVTDAPALLFFCDTSHGRSPPAASL